MIIENANTGGYATKIAHFTDLGDIANVMREHRARYNYSTDEGGGNWAGGTVAEFYDYCKRGKTSYAADAKKLADMFSNLSIEGMTVDYEFNHRYGMVDPVLMAAGAPQPFYGPTVTINERAPVHVYLDTWVSSNVPADNIRLRGIACLALLQVLQIFRPVIGYVAEGASTSSGNCANIIQLVPIPVNDVAKAAFMMCDPLYTRLGMIHTACQISNTKHDPIRALKQGADWQQDKMATWLADRAGVSDVVHLGMMRGRDKRFETLEGCVSWVQSQVDKFR